MKLYLFPKHRKNHEFSYLGMETYYEMNTVDPKLSVLVREDMPQDFAELYARCIRDGRTAIVSLNYDVVVAGLIRHGRTPEDAANFVPIGCYEPAVAGKEISCSGSTHIYLPIPLLSVINSGKDYATFEDFKIGYLEQIRKISTLMQEKQTLCDLAWKYVNPVPLLSGTFDSCLEKARDISDAGALYNTTGCVCSYLADAVDSLEAVRFLVYEQKLCTLPELRQILKDNWEGHEKLRATVLRNHAKWGNNDPRVDALAVEIASFVSQLLFNLPNGRGGSFFPSLYGQLVVERGKMIGALPSGRLAGEPMSKNMDAVIGMDRNGITALMNSVLKVDMRQFPCGTCLDIMLHPSAVRGDDGVQILVSLIRTFIAHGGSGIQFNIFDAAVLRDAQSHPEKYENLQVRVCGWNVRFTDLDSAAQETFIRQAEAIA
ncbi:MAG: pyruvate formate lyase family protein [Lentisphaeria bacterium]